jgi:hypothetical protein
VSRSSSTASSRPEARSDGPGSLGGLALESGLLERERDASESGLRAAHDLGGDDGAALALRAQCHESLPRLPLLLGTALERLRTPGEGLCALLPGADGEPGLDLGGAGVGGGLREPVAQFGRGLLISRRRLGGGEPLLELRQA